MAAIQVTTGNNKAASFRLKCAATGLFMADATADFRVLAITYRADGAFLFPCDDAAEHGRKFLKSLYPSFDWQAVLVEG